MNLVFFSLNVYSAEDNTIVMHQIQAVKARQSRNQHIDAYFGQIKT